MSLPFKVWIKPGVSYKVLVVKGLERSTGNIGVCDAEARTISIDSRLTSRQKKATLVHEIVHAVDFEINKEFSIAEKTVLAIEASLFKLYEK